MGQTRLVAKYRKRAKIQYPQCLCIFLIRHRTLIVGAFSVRRESTNGRFEGGTTLQLCSTYMFFSTAAVTKLNIFFSIAGAHHNTLENIPIVYLLYVVQVVLWSGTDGHLSTVLTGTKYPIAAASACTAWSISRIAYTCGYLTGNPGKVRTIFILSPYSELSNNYSSLSELILCLSWLPPACSVGLNIYLSLYQEPDKIFPLLRALGHLDLHRWWLALGWFQGQVPLNGI